MDLLRACGRIGQRSSGSTTRLAVRRSRVSASGDGPGEPVVLLRLAGAVQGEAGVLLGLFGHLHDVLTGWIDGGDAVLAVVGEREGGRRWRGRRGDAGALGMDLGEVERVWGGG